jgi:uncharacterized protein YndB with AHSA1/START domain
MSYELKLERILDAPRELVFDTIVDPAFADDIFGDQVEGWTALRFDIDLRVGGAWTVEFGPRDGSGEKDVLNAVFTAIDRPRLIAYDSTMYVAEWGRWVTFSETITLEDQDGKTVLTLVQDNLESEADRDAFLSGVPGWIDAIQRVAERRAREGTP